MSGQRSIAFRRRLFLTVAVALIAPMLSSCSDPVTQAVGAIDDAINAFNAQSNAWQNTLDKLETKLEDIESTANNDAGTILNQTTDNVHQLLGDSIEFAGGELNKAIDHLSDEARCTVGFFTDSMNSELGHLKQNLEFWKKNKKQLDPLVHHTCWVDPSVINVYRVGGNWGVNTDNIRDKGHTIYLDGYNFRSGDALPSVDLMSGTSISVAKMLTPRYVDGYQIAIDLPSTIPDFADNSTLTLHWPDDAQGADSTAIGLQKTGQPKLELDQINWNPAGQALVGDQVWPVVTVTNTGTAQSTAASSVSWEAGDGWKSPVITVGALDPGQSTPSIALGPHQYAKDGDYPAIVQITGQSTAQSSVHTVHIMHVPAPEKDYGDFPNDYTKNGKSFGGSGLDSTYGDRCDDGYVRAGYDLKVAAVSRYHGVDQANAKIKWADPDNANDCRVTVHYSIKATGNAFTQNSITITVDVREKGV